MHWSLFLPFVLSCIGIASSEAILPRWKLHEQHDSIPSGWKLLRKYDPSAAIPLRFALQQSNLEALDEYLYDVSHPSSPNYGKHWTADQVASVFAPTLNGTIFNPSLPSGRPYVASVGATQINPGKTVYDAESAWNDPQTGQSSAGGFSNYFALPRYQRDAMQSIWNSTGNSRAFPDISVNGANFMFAAAGQFVSGSGTSASTPTLGAMLTMINDARLAVGKSTIGFINPAIYSTHLSDAFHDITTGNNPGCGTPGFKASAGWDPVTGLGTPNLPKLLEKWLALP